MGLCTVCLERLKQILTERNSTQLSQKLQAWGWGDIVSWVNVFSLGFGMGLNGAILKLDLTNISSSTASTQHYWLEVAR